MASAEKSSGSFKTKSILFWFALCAGVIACYILYKHPHIPLSTLFKNILIYGSIFTIIIQFLELFIFKILKTIRRTQRKKRREHRRRKMHVHTKRIKKGSEEKAHHSPW